MASTDYSFPENVQQVIQQACQSLASSSSEQQVASQFVIFGYQEQQPSQQEQQQKSSAVVIPRNLYIQYSSQDTPSSAQSVYEASLTHFQESTLNYLVYKSNNNGNATTKYSLVSWVGTKVKPSIKAKIQSAHRDQLHQLCEKSLNVKFSNEVSGVNEDNHKEQINESFLNGRLFTNSESTSTSSSSSSGGKSVTSRFQPGAGQSSSTSSSTGASRSSNLAAQLRLVLSIDDKALGSTLKQMQNNEVSWVVMSYDDNGALRVTAQGSEQQQTSVVRPYLLDNDINFALFKWNMGSELGYGSDTEKILFVVWVGQQINSIRRGKINQHRAKVYSFINNVFQLSGEYEVTSSEELSDEIIKNRMLGNKGGTISSTSSSPAPSPRNTVSGVSPINSPRSVTGTVASPRSGSLWKNAAKVVVPQTKYMARKEAAKQAVADTVLAGKKALSTAANTIKVFASEECAEELEKFVGSDSKSIWALFAYHEGSKNQLKLIETGSREADKLISDSETLKKECAEENLAFIVVKAYVSVKRGTKKVITAKYILVTFKGKKLKPYFKVISANHAGKLKNTIAPIVNVSDDFVTVTDLADLDNFQKLFSRDELVSPDGSMGSTNLEPNLTPITPSSPNPKAATGLSAGTPALASDLTFEDEKAVQEALADLQSDGSDTNWVMVKYASRRKIALAGKGDQGLEQFKSQLDESQVQYVFYKLFIEELGGSAKIVLIASVGKNVKMAVKATSTTDRLALFKYAESLCGVSSEFQANELDEVNTTAILGKLTGAKGKLAGGRSSDITTTTSSTTAASRPQFGGKNQELKIADEQAVNEALNDLKDDQTTTNWLLFGYDQQGAHLELKQKGSDGIEGLSPHLQNNQVQYALLKLLVEETGYGGSPKITLIAWVGEEVTGMAKAKSSTHRLLLKEFCLKVLAIAAEYPVNMQSELSESSIRAKLTGSKGKVESDDATTSAASTSVVTSQKSMHKKFGGKDGNLKFADESAVLADIELLKDNKSDVRWLMFGYTNPDEDFYTSAIVEKGSGGVSAFKQHLRSDRINYVLLRMAFMEYYGVVKVVLITFVGEDSPPFLKSLSAGHRVNLMEFARKHVSIGGEFHPQDLEELTDQALLGKITGAKGGENASNPTTNDSEEPYASQKASRWEPQREVRTNIEIKDKNQFTGDYKAIEFTGGEQVTSALKELASKSDVIYQDEATRLDYIKLSIQGKTMRDVVVEEMGKGSLTEEWRSKHLDESRINIFILAVSSSEGGTGMITKYVFVQWNGSKTKFLERAQASELRQTLYDFCTKILFMSAEIQGCTQPEHITQKIVMEKLTGSNVRGSETKVERKQEKFMKLGKEKSKLTYENEQDMWDALTKLTQLEDPEIDWMLVTYKENTIDVLQLAHTGKGCVDDYRPFFKPDNMCYLVVKIMHAFGYQKDFADTLSKPYYGLVHWKGTEVSVLEKAMSSHHWNHFAKTITKRLQSMQLAVQGSQYHAEHLEEVTLERIKKTMRLVD